MNIRFDSFPQTSSVVVLGMFDGVHLGHQALFRQGREMADRLSLPLAVCSFEPHPLEVLRPDTAPRRLTTLPERADLMAAFGVDELCVHTFTADFAAQTPAQFLDWLEAGYHPAALVCGFNYTYGRFGGGSSASLRAWCQTKGLPIVVVPEVVIDGTTVSSTRIRAALLAGDIPLANRLLGHSWPIRGAVVHGKGIGHQLGFPTANIQVPETKLLPAFGVYACQLTCGGAAHPALTNIGRHPTLPEGGVTVEAFVLEGQPDLYGAEVTLTPLCRLRGEHTFPNVQALSAQIQLDVAQARRLFRQDT